MDTATDHTGLCVEVDTSRVELPFIPDQVALPSISHYSALLRCLGPRHVVQVGGCPPPVWVAAVVIDPQLPPGCFEIRNTLRGDGKRFAVRVD